MRVLILSTLALVVAACAPQPHAAGPVGEDLNALASYVRQFPPKEGTQAVIDLPHPAWVLYGLGAIPDAASRIDVENARRWRVPAASLTVSSKEKGRSRESASWSTSTRCGSESDLRSSFGSASRVVGPPSHPSAYERSDGS
jgi:hypothetical protein